MKCVIYHDTPTSFCVWWCNFYVSDEKSAFSCFGRRKKCILITLHKDLLSLSFSKKSDVIGWNSTYQFFFMSKHVLKSLEHKKQAFMHWASVCLGNDVNLRAAKPRVEAWVRTIHQKDLVWHLDCWYCSSGRHCRQLLVYRFQNISDWMTNTLFLKML